MQIIQKDITRSDFEKACKLNNLEYFTSDQVESWLKDSKELIEKSQTEELDDIEKSLVDEFTVTAPNLSLVSVINDDLTKSAMYVRPSQIDWDKDENGDLMKAKSGTYSDTPENRKLGRVGQKYGGSKGEVSSDKKDVEHKHDLKEGQLVKFEGKEHRVVEIKGNSVRLSGTQGSVHITKLSKPDGSQVIKKEGGEEKKEEPKYSKDDSRYKKQQAEIGRKNAEKEYALPGSQAYKEAHSKQ
jgi:hypothetical protein